MIAEPAHQLAGARKNFTLTAPQVHRCAAVVLQDHLKLGDHGPKCRASLLFTLLLYAAARITSLSDACKALRDAPSDEAVRLALIATLPDFAELQRRLNAALADNLPRTLRRSPQRMAADLVLIPYHGQPQHDPDEIYRSEAKSGTSHFHAYATLYVIRNGYRFTVALTPVSRGEPLEAVLKRLLHQAAQVGIRCRLLLLDRGFYSVGVIRYLQAAHHPFLMPVICRGRRLDDPRGPSGTNVFLTWQSSGFGTYTLHDAQKRPARVTICVKCRYYRGQWRRHGKQHLIYAFWGTSASILRLGPGDVSPAVRHRDDLSTVTSGPDSDLDTRSGAAAALRGDRPDLAECLGLVAPDGAGPASSRQSRDPLGFAAVPEDVAVVDACGGRNPGDPRLGYC